jgi:hypothetical protein
LLAFFADFLIILSEIAFFAVPKVVIASLPSPQPKSDRASQTQQNSDRSLKIYLECDHTNF